MSYQYNANGRRGIKTLANGALTKYDYDVARQLTMLRQNAPGFSASSNYTYDAAGNRTNQLRGDGTSEAYGYDATDQLTSANADNQAIGLKDHQGTYAYDPNGNRTNITDNGNAIAYASNTLNQYTIAAGDPLTYNANGSLTSQKGWTYTYDAQNRLVSAQKGATQMGFAYDGQNRCIKRTLNGTPTYLCYAGWNLIEEHAGSGNLNTTYVHGANTDEMLIKSDVNGTVYYHQDALGNVTYLSDEKGNLVEQYRYDAFGLPMFLDAQNNVLANSAYGNRFLFTGREWLQDIALYDYRNRIDSAELGRFLQPDPLRFAVRDVNLYRYCFNNPINLLDPHGLRSSNMDAAWGAFPDVGKSCKGSPANLTKFERKDYVGWFMITMTADIQITGTYKDLRIRWWTCWRPDGGGGYISRCNDQKSCGFGTIWSPLPGLNSGPHLTRTLIRYLSCESNCWKLKEGSISKGFAAGLTGWE